MTKEALPQLPPAAENNITSIPTDLREAAGAKILNLSHVELHAEDSPIPKEDLGAEHQPHINKISEHMERASELLGTAHQELSGTDQEPTFDELATKAKEIALSRAKEASQSERKQDSVQSLSDLLVIEALSATKGDERQARSEKIFKDIQEQGLIDEFIVATHESFGLVARHGEELVPLNSVAQANESELSGIQTRNYNDDFSEISPRSYEDEKQLQTSFEALKQLEKPLLANMETEAERKGIQNTHLITERDPDQINGGMAVLQGVVRPYERVGELPSRDVFISHSFYVDRRRAIKLSMAMDAMGMMPRMDNKGVGTTVKEDLNQPDGFTFFTKWRNEFRAHIKKDGYGLVMLSPDALDSEVVAWEVGVMRQKGCNIVVSYDESQNQEGQQTVLEKLDSMIEAYDKGELETPGMLARENMDYGDVLRSLRDAQRIKLEPRYFEDQDQLGKYIVDSLISSKTKYPDESPVQKPAESEAAPLDMDKTWAELQRNFETIERIIDQSAMDPEWKLLQRYKVDISKVLLTGMVRPGELVPQLKKKTLHTPDSLIGQGTEDAQFLRGLQQEFQNMGFTLGPDSPGNSLNLLLQTNNTIEANLEPGAVNDFYKFFLDKEPIFPIFIGQKIFSNLARPRPDNTELSPEAASQYHETRDKMIEILRDRQTLVFTDNIVDMSPEVRQAYTERLAGSLTTKFALNELALDFNKKRNELRNS